MNSPAKKYLNSPKYNERVEVILVTDKIYILLEKNTVD